MWAGYTRRLVLVGLLGWGVMCGFVLSHTAAQQDDCKNNPAVWCGPNRNKAPAPGPARTPSTNRRPRPVAAQPAPRPAVPLELHWWLLKGDGRGAWKPVSIGDDRAREVISIEDTFLPSDQLRLAVRAEQDGYLYVIHQPSPQGDGRLLFPSRYYKSAEGSVRKGQTFYLPDGLASPTAWLSLPTPVASETIRLVLSRERIRELQHTGEEVVNVKKELIESLLKYSPKELSYRVGYPDNVAKVKRAGAGDGRNIVEMLTLSGAGADKAAAGPAPQK